MAPKLNFRTLYFMKEQKIVKKSLLYMAIQHYHQPALMFLDTVLLARYFYSTQ